MNLTEKTSLRAFYREIRKNIPERDDKQNFICRNFLDSELYNNASSLFLYAAVGSEVNIDPIIEKALSDGKKVALPLCLDKEGTMEFYFITSFDDVKVGMYGIREPNEDICHKAEHDENTVCLLPGLCFDKKGNRLGYGKGYYDRFLAHFSGISVGISFSDCIAESLAVNEHDKKAHYLIIDKNIYFFKMKED